MKNIVKNSRSIAIYLITLLFALTLFISAIQPNIYVRAAENDIVDGQTTVEEDLLAGYADEDEIFEKGNAVNQHIMEEGIVLLKNADNALPLQKQEEVAFLGRNTRYMLLYGGGAAAPKNVANNANFTRKILADEYKTLGGNVNQTAYNYFHGDTFNELDDANNQMDYSREMDANLIDSSVTSSFSAQGDVGVITISRSGSEQIDLSRTVSKKTSIPSKPSNVFGKYKTGGALNDGDHSLMLSPAELRMIDYANKHFDKVVLLINSANPIELGFLDNEEQYEEQRGLNANTYNLNVDAALWVAFPGNTGATAIAKVLLGDVNPSGRLVDIYPRDFTKDPVWQNKGEKTNAGGDAGGGASPGKIGYVHYEEDIYYGYKYWETRGYEERKADEGSTWYEDNVLYPFGYGLSYTSFEYELIKASPAANSSFDRNTRFSVEVKVTNTGSKAGKETVQAYYSAPYGTDAPIEKSFVNLVAFAKTKLLNPGESDNVTLTFSADDMKSFDWKDINENGFKGYELEAGEYSIKIAKNSHEYPIELTYTLDAGIQCKNDLVTGTEVVNLFDEISDNDIGCKTYLSRADFEGTFPVETARNDQGYSEKEYLCTEEDDKKYKFYVDAEDMPYYAPEAGTKDTNEIQLYHMQGRDYNDPLWEKLLDQLSIQEMANLVGEGCYRTNALASIGKPYTYEADGPTGWVSEECHTIVCFASTCVLASTFNTEIATEYGIHLAKEGNTPRKHKNGKDTVNFTGLYAPGVNLHRSQFGGRNFEYLSEDPVLTGFMAAAQVRAMTERGIAAYVKHFALNEQETNRYLINTWASEQNMRENYFKAFELVVKHGNPIAMMNSYNNIGYYQSGMIYDLNITVLRNEWGYQGSLITDWGSHTKMNGGVNAIIRGGIDHIMNNNNGKLHPPTTTESELTATLVTAIRRGAKNVLYKISRTSAVKLVEDQVPLSGSYSGGDLVAVADKSISLSIAGAKGYKGLDAEFVYTVKDGNLPTGVTLSEDGTLSGTPTSAGKYTFTVAAIEKGNAPARAKYSVPDAVFSLDVQTADTQSVIWTPDYSAERTVASGAYFSMDIQAYAVGEDGVTSADFSYELTKGNLPQGITLTGNTISGTPEESEGIYSVEVTVSADGYASKVVQITLNVKVVEMVFDVTKIDPMEVGAEVNVNIGTACAAVEGDTLTGIRYSLKSGSKLPNGLSLSADGVISGVPTKGYDDYRFTVVAKANEAMPVETEFSITVKGIVVDDLEKTVYLGKNTYIDLNELVYSNNIADGSQAPKFFYELVGDDALPEGFKMFANGIIIGNTDVMKDSAVTVKVSALNEKDVEMKIRFVVDEIYYESGDVEYGDLEDAVDPLEKVPETSGSSKNDGIDGGLIAICVIVPVVVLGAAAVVAVVLVKKRKHTDK